MFAVVDYKGNQYKLEPEKEYRIDKVDQKESKLVFSDVLLYSDEKVNLVGRPHLDQVTVEAEIIGQTRDKKVRVLKFHAKKRYKRLGSQKAHKTIIKVTKISLKNVAEKKPLVKAKKINTAKNEK